MGIVFGRTGATEPVYTIVMAGCGGSSNMSSGCGATSSVMYDIRRYGKRFAAATDYRGKMDDNGDSSFRLLADYIGVFGNPQNTGTKPIAMTAPVVTNPSKGTQIAMTAPVVTSGHGDDSSKLQSMAFILPEEYHSLDQIPQPTNPAVYIKEIPPAVGAVHKFSGWVNDQQAEDKMKSLIRQLNEDGISITEEFGMAQSLLWQYHPPFTLPFLRRNEIWLQLTEEQVSTLQKQQEVESGRETATSTTEQ